MQHFFRAFAAFALVGVASAQEPPPVTAPAAPPLLQIYEIQIKDPYSGKLSYDEEHPLLAVREFSDVRLAHDDKGVLLILRPDNAKVLAAVTREYAGSLLMFKTMDGTVRPITIKDPVEDGRIGFKYPEAEPLAADYRRYFHLGEFRLQGR